MEVFNGLSSSSAGDVMRSLFPGMLGSAKGPLKQMSGASSVEAPLSIDVGQRDYETVVSVGGSAKDQRVPGQELSGGGGQGQHASLNGHGCQRNGEFQGATGGGSSGIGGAPISGHASYVGGSGLPGGGPGVSGGGVGPPGGGPPFGGQGNGYGDFPGGVFLEVFRAAADLLEVVEIQTYPVQVFPHGLVGLWPSKNRFVQLSCQVCRSSRSRKSVPS